MIAAITTRIDIFEGQEKYYCNKIYIDWLHQHNISILMINDFKQIANILDICDILIIPGGYDVDPTISNLKRENNYPYYLEVDYLDLALLKAFHLANKPVLGICRGMQIINMYFQGTLFQNIKNHINTSHPLLFTKNSILKQHYKNCYEVNSYHHQAIDKLSPFLQLEAIASDGIIEAISYQDYIIGVQWHPEKNKDDPILLYFLEYLKNTSQKNKP